MKIIEVDVSKPNWIVDLFESLDKEHLQELLRAVALIVDPLGQELIQIASKDEDKERIDP